MTQEAHPFSKFIAILGRGKTLSRALDVDEAQEAMTMILRGEALPEQVGAFMMLQRFQEESPGEVAGFARAVRTELKLPANIPDVDIDWSSYAGKRRQLPWFILSALLLARSGYKVFMHGTEGHTPGRVYTRDTLKSIGLDIAGSLEEASTHIAQSNFAYVPLEVLSPKLRELIDLRHVFGLRSPVHTFSRMINPFNAPCMMQGIFHRGFMETHTGAGEILGQPHMAVFRGEGGEIERRPNKPTEVWALHDGVTSVERWPVLTDDPRQPADEEMDVMKLAALWRGELEDDYAARSVTGTLAIALKALQAASSLEEAQQMADAMWLGRDMSRLLAVA